MTELMKPAGWRSASFGLNWSARGKDPLILCGQMMEL